MTDPVDTDALRDLAGAIGEAFRGERYDASPEAIDEPALIRAAADELDRLRAELDAWEPAWRNMRDQRDKARTAIEDAPHEEDCRTRLPKNWVNRTCDCWKADAVLDGR